MEKFKKKNILILILSTIILVSMIPSTDNNIFLTGNSEVSSLIEERDILNTAGYWNLTGTPIYIDGDATGVGAHNWTWAESQPWCSGSGTWAQPYLIENVTIDGLDGAYCIFIEDSSVYFTIRNCTLYDVSTGPSSYILRTLNVANATIYNNTCYDGREGIHIRSGSNNTIEDNFISQTLYAGIFNYLSDDNRIINNTIADQNRDIILYESENVNITENKMISAGIYMSANSIARATSHKIDTSNTLNGKPVYYYAGENNLDNTNFSNAGQIILGNCDNSILSNINISDGTRGISLYHSTAITITECNFTNPIGQSVYFENSDNNIINNNTFNGVSNAVHLYGQSDYNNITDNTVTNCITAAYLYSTCAHNNISNNEINIASGYGVAIIGGGIDNTISKNNISSVGNYGIYFDSNANNNNITDNNIRDGTQDGIQIVNTCDGNRIEGNNITGNGNYGVFLRTTCEDNQILKNNISDNDNEGVRIQQSNNNMIRDNLIDGKNNQGDGIVLIVGSANNEIINNTIRDNVNNGIELYNSVQQTKIINNTITDNHDHGIHMWANFGPINRNYVFNNTIQNNDDHGIYLQATASHGCDYNEIYYNTIVDNNIHGIYVLGLTVGNQHNVISNNTLRSNNFVGIYVSTGCFNTTVNYNTLIGEADQNIGIEIVSNSHNCTVIGNYISDHFFNGLYLQDGNHTKIVNNTIIGSDQEAIGLTTCSNSIISRNVLDSNAGNGITLKTGCLDNNINDNNMTNNNQSGIFINDNCDDNIITNNLIYNNTDYGLLINSSDCSANLIYLNNFSENGINGYDNGTNNQWDNGTIGNIWDDYDGCDDNSDGIGETDYLIPGNGGGKDENPMTNKQCPPPATPPSTDSTTETTETTTTAGGGIPFGSFYLLFLLMSVVGLVFAEKKRRHV